MSNPAMEAAAIAYERAYSEFTVEHVPDADDLRAVEAAVSAWLEHQPREWRCVRGRIDPNPEGCRIDPKFHVGCGWVRVVEDTQE